MSIYLLYALLPLIVFPLTSVFLAKVSRQIGSLLTTFLRQIFLLFIGLPIIFITPDFFSELLWYWKEFLLSWLFGSLYLYSVFKSCDYIEVIQGRVVNVIVRVLFSIVIGVLVLGEVLNMYEILGITMILVGISLYLKIKNENTLPQYNLPLWVGLNMIWGILFVGSGYYFSIYAQGLPPLMAAYMLELASIPFLIVTILLTDMRKDMKKILRLASEHCKLLLFGTVPVLLGSYGLAQSYVYLDFIIVNVLFCATLVMAGVFAWLILWEKLTKLQMLIFSCIITGLFIVNYF